MSCKHCSKNCKNENDKETCNICIVTEYFGPSEYEPQTEKPINSGYNVLADGCVAMDERRYLSMIADIRDRWMNGSKPEITAMEWMAKEIYMNFIVTEKKATVS